MKKNTTKKLLLGLIIVICAGIVISVLLTRDSTVSEKENFMGEVGAGFKKEIEAEDISESTIIDRHSPILFKTVSERLKKSDVNFIQYSDHVYIDSRLKGRIKASAHQGYYPSVDIENLTEEMYYLKLYIDWKDDKGKIVEGEEYPKIIGLKANVGQIRFIGEWSEYIDRRTEGDFIAWIRLITPNSYSVKGIFEETPDTGGRIAVLDYGVFYNQNENLWEMKVKLKNLTERKLESEMILKKYQDEDGRWYKVDDYWVFSLLPQEEKIMGRYFLPADVVNYVFTVKVENEYAW